MKIDEQLNLVIPCDRDDGSTIYVHASPIGREVFQRFWLPLAKAYNQIMSERLFFTGPRVASLMLKQAAETSGAWEGPMGVETGLLPEIRRLANVVAPGAGRGWQMIPYTDAVRDEIIDEEDADQIEGLLVFFTLVWRLHRRADRQMVLSGAVAMWNASISSASLSAFVNSLPTSIATASTGATAPEPYSQPSSTGVPGQGSRPVSGIAPKAISHGAAPLNFASATPPA